ncbi:hypothetical protein MKX03_037599 [Papaver bracteatum]|nr:hypothetical protein MKX03_037599 [Papaver bracteatum]
MESLLLLIFAFCLLVGIVGNNATPLPSEIYWKNKLPDTPMPAILHDLLHPGSNDKLPDYIAYNFTWARRIKNTTNLEKANSQKCSKTPPLDKSTIQNDSAASERQLQDNAGASLFFLEKDLYPGAKMKVHFVIGTPSGTAFLPKNLAKVTPFSSSKLPEILNQFAINPKSNKAEFISRAINACEQPAMENQEKYCATSLESLFDYGTSKFGKNVNILTTEIVVDKGQRTRMRKLQQYVVSSGLRQVVIFYCHATLAHTAQPYVVPLVGVDGTKIKATAVCHKDTSKWNPDHVAFRVLNVKPGTIPICHFLTEDNIGWAAKNKDN